MRKRIPAAADTVLSSLFVSLYSYTLQAVLAVPVSGFVLTQGKIPTEPKAGVRKPALKAMPHFHPFLRVNTNGRFI